MTKQKGPEPTTEDQPVTITPDDLLGVDDVMAQLDISKSTLGRLTALGQLRPFKVMAGRTGARLYLRRDVDRYAEDRQALYDSTLSELNELDATDNDEE